MKGELVLCLTGMVTAERFSKPGLKSNVRSRGRRASGAARASRASPIILGSIDATGADRCFIECANVGHANVAPQQIIEVDINLGRRIDCNIVFSRAAKEMNLGFRERMDAAGAGTSH
jgi:hypothetical protein